MYTMSPEDRLRMVVRQQNELRDEMARERMATAAAATRSTARPAQRTARGAAIPPRRWSWRSTSSTRSQAGMRRPRTG